LTTARPRVLDAIRRRPRWSPGESGGGPPGDNQHIGATSVFRPSAKDHLFDKSRPPRGLPPASARTAAPESRLAVCRARMTASAADRRRRSTTRRPPKCRSWWRSTRSKGGRSARAGPHGDDPARPAALALGRGDRVRDVSRRPTRGSTRWDTIQIVSRHRELRAKPVTKASGAGSSQARTGRGPVVTVMSQAARWVGGRARRGVQIRKAFARCHELKRRPTTLAHPRPDYVTPSLLRHPLALAK